MLQIASCKLQAVHLELIICMVSGGIVGLKQCQASVYSITGATDSDPIPGMLSKKKSSKLSKSVVRQKQSLFGNLPKAYIHYHVIILDAQILCQKYHNYSSTSGFHLELCTSIRLIDLKAYQASVYSIREACLLQNG